MDAIQIIRRIDLDGDTRVSKDEFINALKPNELYSKLLRKAKDKIQNKYLENLNHQGENYLNYQDPALNLNHKGR